MLRSFGLRVVASTACGGWTCATIYLGDQTLGSLMSAALAVVPIMVFSSLIVVGLFLEGSERAARSGIMMALSYILLANVAIVLNPLYFFPNYGVASTIYQRVAGAVVALPLFTLAVLVAVGYCVRLDLRAALRPFESWLIVFFVLVTLLSFGVGIARSNFAPYVVSDLAKDLVVPAAWIVFRYASRFVAPEALLRLVVGFALLPPLFDIVYHLRGFVLNQPYERYGGYTALPLAFFVALMVLGARGGARLGATAGTSTMLVSSLLSFSRMTWLQAVSIVAAGLWTARRTKRGPVLAIVIAMFVVLSGVLIGNTESFNELIGSRFTELFSSQEDEFSGIGGEVSIGGLSGARKLTETYSVLAEFAGGGVIEWMFGFGAGAEFEHLAPSLEVQQIYEFRNLRIHNIHNFIVAVLFRKGFVGVLLLIILLVSFWQELRRIGRSRLSTEQRILLWTVKVFFALSLVKSMSVDVLLWTLEWGALFAIVGSLSNEVRGVLPNSTGALTSRTVRVESGGVRG